MVLVEDLQSQIQDLQEANETSSAEVLRLDQENQMLTAHIKRLSADRDENTEAERDLLQQQVSQRIQPLLIFTVNMNFSEQQSNIVSKSFSW